MATTLISFVGRPPFAEKANREYKPTVYRFGDDQNSDISASFFGVALQKNLLAKNRDVRCWLLMGTHQSIWQTLLEIIPEEKQGDLSEIFIQIADEVATDGFVKNKTLQNWEESINSFTKTKILFRLVGDGSNKESQENIWKAIDEAVKVADKIVVDVTHGLRHQPIIASFMVMFLRWAKNIEHIEMFYGAFDLADKSKGFCPVLELPICNELLKASEAISNFYQTGNFVKLGESLKLSSENVEKVAFSIEMNKSDKGTASKLLKELEQKSLNLNPIEKSIEPLMKEALDWQGMASLAYVYQRRSEVAFEHQQYFQAIALLWEALRTAGQISNPNSHHNRRNAEEKIKKSLPNHESEIFQIIGYLRNAVMHGTDPETSKVEQKVIKARKDLNYFKYVFDEGQKILKSLLIKV